MQIIPLKKAISSECFTISFWHDLYWPSNFYSTATSFPKTGEVNYVFKKINTFNIIPDKQ